MRCTLPSRPEASAVPGSIQLAEVAGEDTIHRVAIHLLIQPSWVSLCKLLCLVKSDLGLYLILSLAYTINPKASTNPEE